MTLTAEQREQRRHGITATDMVVLCGLSRYRSPFDVYTAKVEGEDDDAAGDSDRAKWGQILEEPIRTDYRKRHDCYLLGPARLGTLQHPDVEWAMATPDAMVVSWRDDLGWTREDWKRGLEIKTHTWRLAHLYGEPGTDEVPPDKWVQCAWNMYVSGVERWDLVPFIDGLPTDYHLERDEELEGRLVEIAEQFWRDHVLARRPPEPDGSEAYTKRVNRIRQELEDLIPATAEVVEAAAALRRVRRELKRLERDKELSEQTIKMAIAEHAGVQLPGGEKITWKRAKDSQRIDWQAIAGEYRALLETYIGRLRRADKKEKARAELEEIVARHTQSRKGSRRFLVPRAWANDDQEEANDDGATAAAGAQ